MATICVFKLKPNRWQYFQEIADLQAEGRPYVRGFRRVVEETVTAFNERITAARVRVVGENIKVDVYPTAVAIKMAQEQGLDLVEISPNADPPVCKVIDYSKFKYEQKKKQKEIKANAQKTVVKENQIWAQYR